MDRDTFIDKNKKKKYYYTIILDEAKLKKDSIFD